MPSIWPQHTNNDDIDAAGRVLSQGFDADPTEWQQAAQLVNQWRVLHSHPLNTFRNNLRRRVSSRGVIAQRLKRLPTIISKLERLHRIRLSQMQDIGGCRAVVQTANAAFDLASDLTSSGIRHQLVRANDYISNPRPSGYRGLHLIYSYHSDRQTLWQGLQIELQFRSRLQHQWATAVETVGTLTGNDLKSSQGDPTWLRFFALMSSVIALRERTAPVPGTPPMTKDLINEIRECDASIGISSQLQVFQAITGQVPTLRNVRNRLVILELNWETRKVNGWTFRIRDDESASEFYLSKEEENRDNASVDVVLVSTDSLATLRRVYPNYFIDIRGFRRLVRETIEGG